MKLSVGMLVRNEITNEVGQSVRIAVVVLSNIPTVPELQSSRRRSGT